jgi:hypothetical protein
MEILESNVPLPEVITALKDRGYLIEIERELELSDDGKTERIKYSVKPMESALRRLINRCAFRIDLKLSDLFGGKT